jgi:hypothetical protein
MKRPAEDVSEAIEQLNEEVRELTLRVQALELQGHALVSSVPQAQIAGGEAAPLHSPAPSPVYTAADAAADVPGGLAPVIGKAILAVAGAFLLRAAAESGVLPWGAAVTIGFVYAGFWLASARKNTVYGAAAALIFFPMLWETTVQFRVLPVAAAAGSLAVFALIGSRTAIWVAALASAMAMVLTVATGSAFPFAVALVAICAVVEIACGLGQRSRVRGWVAPFVDAGVVLTVMVASASRNLGNYKPVGHAEAAGLCIVLLAIYAASAEFQTRRLARNITIAGAAQLAAAFALAVWGWLALGYGPAPMGILCAMSAVAFYRASVVAGKPRNQHVFGSFGLGLTVTGSVLVLPLPVAAMVWAGLAIAGLFAPTHSLYGAAPVHGAVLLVLSAFASGLLEYGQKAMTGVLPGWPSLPIGAVALSACVAWAACGYEAGGRWARLVPGILAVFAGAALAVSMARSGSAAWLETIRTVVLCFGGLALGVFGTRFRKPELVWIGYGAIALVTVKLVLADFRAGRPEALAVSLVCYGAVLIFGSRLMRWAERAI